MLNEAGDIALSFERTEAPMRSSLIALLLLLSASEASAVCVCRCVNGEVRTVCGNPGDVRPVCAQNVCPLVSPSQPVETLPSQPIGRPGCSRQQVLNRRTGEYQWRQICE
jgi:hypothetical protein